MWMYLSIILLGILLALIFFVDNRITGLTNRLNLKIRESRDLNEQITDQDNTIRSLEHKIEQISTTDGISLEYREILDNLEKQNVKDKEQINNYKTELDSYKTKLDSCNKLVDTLRSDIVAIKSKPRTDRFHNVHVLRPSVNIDIPLRDIPKQALIQSIHFIESSSIGLKHVSFKRIVKILGYDVTAMNCRTVGSLLRNMHFKVKKSKVGMVMLLDNERNRKKLNTLYAKYCNDKK